MLQSERGIVGLLCHAREQKIPSPAVFGQITEAFKAGLRAWCEAQGIAPMLAAVVVTLVELAASVALALLGPGEGSLDKVL